MGDYLSLNRAQLAYIIPATLYSFWLACVGWLNHYWTFIHLGREHAPLLYILFFIANAAGIAVFALWFDRNPSVSRVKNTLLSMGLLSSLFTVSMAFSPGSWLLLICLLCGLTSGFFMAFLTLFIYHNIPLEKRGFTIGLAAASGVALHFIFFTVLFPQQEGSVLYNKTWLSALLMLLLGFGMLYFPICRDHLWQNNQPLPTANNAEYSKHKLVIFLLLILVSFYLSYGIQDLAATVFWMNGLDYLVYTRVFLIVGFIGGGILCDLRGMHMILNSSFSLLAMGLFSMAFHFEGIFAFIGFSCVQLASAVFLVGIQLLFLDIARFYKKTALVCSLGLVFPSVLKQIGIISADILSNNVSNTSIFTISILPIILALPLVPLLFERIRDISILNIRRQTPLFALASSSDYFPESEPVESQSLKSEFEEKPLDKLSTESQSQTGDALVWDGLIEEFARKYCFTRREIQVLELTLHDLSVLKMAQTLKVSEPTVKHYIRQMLRKTETKNRRELLSLLIKEQADKH